MSATASEPAPRISIGSMLQHWRRARHLSQLALAHEAGLSPRHVCFLETGRARPSREMVLHLAQVLDVPMRDRNAWLLAAGFAPQFRESTLDDGDLDCIRMAFEAILEQHEPYPAVVMNARWDIVRANQGASRFFAWLLSGRPATSHPSNVLRMVFDGAGLRGTITNWDRVAQSLVRRVHREAVAGVLDDATRQLLAEILAYPGVPRAWAIPDVTGPVLPVVPVCFRHHGQTFNYFSTVTVLGTPQDITLQELRIESFFPADRDTMTLARQFAANASDLAASDGTPSS